MSALKLLARALAPVIGCLLSACVTQPSSYVDQSSAGQRDIEATGAAAVEAAKSNKSDLSVTQQSMQQARHDLARGTTTGNYVVYRNGERDHRAELRLMQDAMQYKKPGYGSYASEKWKREFDYRMKRRIDEKIEGWIDDIFD